MGDLACRLRAALTGILFVLRSGIPWQMQAAGVWQRLHRELLNRLRDADRID